MMLWQLKAWVVVQIRSDPSGICSHSSHAPSHLCTEGSPWKLPVGDHNHQECEMLKSGNLLQLSGCASATCLGFSK